MTQEQYDWLVMHLRTVEVGMQEVLRRTKTLERMYNEELVRAVAHLCRVVERLEKNHERGPQPPGGDDGE